MRVLDDTHRLEAIRALMSHMSTSWPVMSAEERRNAARRLQRAYLWLVYTMELDGTPPSRHEYASFLRAIMQLERQIGIKLGRS